MRKPHSASIYRRYTLKKLVTLAFMGSWGSRPIRVPRENLSMFFKWNIPIPTEELNHYSMSPVFEQEGEYFVAYLNRPLATVFIYCCSALQWHYDERFNFRIDIRTEPKMKKKHRIRTVACFTKRNPFVAIKVRDRQPVFFAFKINLSREYPYIRTERFLGFKNSGSTCYIASVLQILFHIGAFRQLIYSFKDPKDEAPATLQKLFVDLQISTRALSLDAFIQSLGSVYDIASVQHDAHEFFMALLERLESDLGPEFGKRVAELFKIVIKKTIVRQDTVTEVSEDCMSLLVVVDGFDDLETSLKMAMQSEDCEGDAEIKKQCFAQLPEVLIMQLCRFKYDAEKATVVELRNPFACPKEVVVKNVKYELFGVIAHSGTPSFGHYLALVKVNMKNQWYMFDDGNASPIDEVEVMNCFANGSAKMRTVTFGAPLAYLVFYVKSDHIQTVQASDSIPLHLAPHRSNKFYSHFLFYDDIKGREVNQKLPPIEWEDPTVSIYSIAKKLRPNSPLLAVSAWAMLPGKSQFIGPLSLDLPAADFVIRGHPTEFFILQSALSKPLFLCTDKAPRSYIDVCMRQTLPELEDYRCEYQMNRVPKELPAGSYVTLTPKAPLNIAIGGVRLSCQLSLSYSDIQSRLAVLVSAKPERILLLHDNQPLIPDEYPYVSRFPHTGIFSYQLLTGDATGCSISLYVPVTFTLVWTGMVKDHLRPIWMHKGATCGDFTQTIPQRLAEIRLHDKYSLQCSKGNRSAINKLYSNSRELENGHVRVDLIRYELPKNKWRIRSMLNAGVPMSIEVRFPSQRTADSFVGTSRVISISKNTTTQDVMERMSKIDPTLELKQEPIDFFLFASNKPKLQYDLAPDENMYQALDKFLGNMTVPSQRIIIGIIAHDPLVKMRLEQGNIKRSLSGVINSRSFNDLAEATNQK